MKKAQRKKFIKKAFSGTEVSVLLEDMYDEIKVIGEQHGGLDKKIDNIGKELNDFRNETKENFKMVMEHFSRIEDDFLDLRKRIDKIDKEKVSLKEFDWLKSKVLEIEDRLEKYKKQQTALTAKS